MRIIGGSAGGTLLKAPKGLAVRPTPDLVRQALFNSLGPRVEDARVLELFAGTGALSLECLSRGAREAVCVEVSGRHAAILRENAERTRLRSIEVRTQDAWAAVNQLAAGGRRFDLILADPPYGEKNAGRRSTSWAQQLLDHAVLPQLLAGGGLFILGHSKRDTLDVPQPWHERKLLKHGDSIIRFFEARAESSPA